jgi:hypothetical protein
MRRSTTTQDGCCFSIRKRQAQPQRRRTSLSPAGVPFRTTNSIYGALAANLRRAIGGTFAQAGPGEMQLSIVVTVVKRQPSAYPHARLQMHDPLAAALEELRWT